MKINKVFSARAYVHDEYMISNELYGIYIVGNKIITFITMTSHYLFLASDELSTELKKYIPFTKKACIFPSPLLLLPPLGRELLQQFFRLRFLFLKSPANNPHCVLFVAGLVIPLFPWVYAGTYGFLPRHSGGGDVEMVTPGQDHPAAAAATKQREKEK